MRILLGELKPALEFAHGFSSEDMLDFIGVFMHVIGRELDGVGQVEFPQAMVANDLAGALPSGRGEKHDVAFLVGGDKTVAR